MLFWWKFTSQDFLIKSELHYFKLLNSITFMSGVGTSFESCGQLILGTLIFVSNKLRTLTALFTVSTLPKQPFSYM